MTQITKYYVDGSGNYLGGYCGAEPPVGAVEVSTPPDHGTDIWTGMEWLCNITTLRARKQAEIRDGADSILAPLGQEYGVWERQSWDEQAQEAAALAASLTASTPLIDAIAAARGMTREDMAQRINNNRIQWKTISGSIIGQRLAYQDALDAATTCAEIEAITVSYTIPEV